MTLFPSFLRKNDTFSGLVGNIVRRYLDGLEDATEQLPKHVIPHRIDGVVEGIYGNIDEVAVLVSLPCVVPQLVDEIHRAPRDVDAEGARDRWS